MKVTVCELEDRPDAPQPMLDDLASHIKQVQTDPDSPFATVEIDPAFAQQSKSTYPRYVTG